MDRQNRAVSSVIATILMIAIVVILAAAISVSFFDVAGDLRDPAPTVGQTSGEFAPGAYEQEVLITHVAGNNVPVKNIEIVVRAAGPGVDSETWLVNLPAEGSDIDSVNIEGDTGIISKGFGESGDSDPNQVIIEDYPTDDNIWNAGETIQFEINVGGADFRDPPVDPYNEADTLEVIIVHTPSNSILSDHTFTP